LQYAVVTMPSLSRSLLLTALLVTPVFAMGCASPTDDAADEEGASDNALTSGSVSKGAELTTTANLNLRTGPSTSHSVITTMEKGSVVVALGDTQSGWYHVETQDGEQGWASGKYLKANGGSTTIPTPKPSATVPSGSAPSGTGAAQTCKASFYDEGQKTANGEQFDPNGMTAAHKTLPFNTKIKVTNTANGESVVVRINDRGPFVAGRCLDLARGAFTKIASTSAGVATVSFQVVQ
jgi:rare lipoprotein A